MERFPLVCRRGVRSMNIPNGTVRFVRSRGLLKVALFQTMTALAYLFEVATRPLEGGPAAA